MSIVFLPGFMCDARLFGPQISAFPGSVSVVSTDQETITGMAQDALSRAPETFALVGLSMGGIVAMEVMRIAPQRVSRLALLDTNYLPETEAAKTVRRRQIEAVQAGGLSEVMTQQLIPKYLGNADISYPIVALCMDMARDLGPQAFVHQSRALMGRRDQADTLRAIDCPTLILCGEEDALCPVSRHREMAAMVPGAGLEIIKGTGHLPTLEKPKETTAALRHWLEKT